MQSALERWREIINARARQMDAAYARVGRSSADFWSRRASGYHRATRDSASSEPLFLRLRDELSPEMTLLDVGAGTGRFTLALAPGVKQVIAVEPNAAMMQYLRQDMSAEGLTNITPLATTWQDAPAELSADVVLCSHVLYPLRDVDTFLLKLHAATRRTCYVYLRATPLDALTAHFWRHFHGEERHLSPEYIHALDVMYELGIYADVQVVTIPVSLRYDSLDRAVNEQIEQLILPNDERTRVELRRMLAEWLVERNDMLVPPVEQLVCAIITFGPS